MTQVNQNAPDSDPEARPSPLLLTRMHAAAPQFVDRLATEVQRQVTAYTGPASGKRHRLISKAAQGAVQSFLETASGRTTSTGRTDQIFTQMGFDEASDGHDKRPMQSALRVATREAWGEIRELAVDANASAATLSRLEDLLHEQMRHLSDRFAAGYAAGARARSSDVTRNRQRLLRAFLAGAEPDVLAELASAAQWPIPQTVTVASLRVGAGGSPPDLLAPTGRLLVDAEADPLIIVGAADALSPLRGAVERAHGLLQAAISWPVAVDGVRQGVRLTRRALALAEREVIPPSSPVIECTDHATQLWLHSDPDIRRHLVQKLLQPLLGETTNSREILSETMLDWLQTRDSAPAIASRLGVHPQTVRYRWKRINELFGEAMHDPEFILQVTLVLRASVPMWRAGDHSDMEFFLSQERA